jgi:hypothetical protein
VRDSSASRASRVVLSLLVVAFCSAPGMGVPALDSRPLGRVEGVSVALG